jgi:hypothetical protein
VTDPIAVALLGDPRTAAALERRLGWPVVATTETDHLDAAAGLDADLVVGLSVVPWPTAEALHARGSAELGAYTGVVSWHALSALHDRLAEAASPGVQGGAHLLVTAPDPGPAADPEDVAFLREVAEAVAGRVQPASRSIAWRGSTRTPTAADALRSLAEAHGRTDVVEAPVSPGDSADPELQNVAEELGMRLTCVDLGAATRIELLAEVVRTVAGHEGKA